MNRVGAGAGGSGLRADRRTTGGQISGLPSAGAGQQEKRQLAGPHPLWAEACLGNLQLQCYFLGRLRPASDPQCWLVFLLVISLQDQGLRWDSQNQCRCVNGRNRDKARRGPLLEGTVGAGSIGTLGEGC